MHLSRFTDYSLRVLFYAANRPDNLITMTEAAYFYDISVEHLRKVVHCLSKAEYIKTYRGKNGGFELARPAGDIRIGDLVMITEGMEALIDCQTQQCCLNPFCSLKQVMQEAQRSFIDTLNRYTLADLLESPEMRVQLTGELAEAGQSL